MNTHNLLLAVQGLIIGATLCLFAMLLHDFGIHDMPSNMRLNSGMFVEQYAGASLCINLAALGMAIVGIIKTANKKKE